MKLLVAGLLLISAQAHAEDFLFMSCSAGPVRTAQGVKTYEAQMISEDRRGVHTIKIYSNSGAQRSEIGSHSVSHNIVDAGPNQKNSAWIDTETGNLLLLYRERAALTREGILLVKDGTETFELETICSHPF